MRQHRRSAAVSSDSDTPVGESTAFGMANQSAREQFSEATAGASRPLPNLDKLEALFGEDFSDVRVHWGGGAALEALQAKAATDGSTIVMGDNADEASLMEELIHVVQARNGGGGGGDGTSSPSDSHEQQASALAGALAGGGEIDVDAIGGLSGSGGIHREVDHGALAYSTPTHEVADPTAAQGDLDASPEQKAQALHSAILNDDIRTISMLLAGNNSAVKASYEGYFGRSVKSSIFAHLIGRSLITALSYADSGEANLQTRVRAVTFGILGTNEDKLYTILETATLEERVAMANNELIRWYILLDTSDSVRARCMQVLDPLREAGGLSGQARQDFLDHFAAQEAELSSQVDTLITRLEARRGWVDDDETGMITDVTAWSKQRGPIADLDVSAGEPAEVMRAVNWLQGQLSQRQYEQALNLIRTGGQPSTMDVIDEAGADSTWGFDDTDETAIYAAITGATPQQRQAILNDEAQLARMLSYLDEGSEQDRAMELLRGGGTGETATAYQELLDALDVTVYVSDATVWGCLERMAPSELVRLRDNTTVREQIEGGVSDVARFHALIGYTAACSSLTVDEQTAELAASNERVVARIQHAVDSMDDDEDQVYRAVLDWQTAGGCMDTTTDAAPLQRARTALRQLGTARSDEIMGALTGSRLVTWRDRLESTAVGDGTDNTGMDDTLTDVPDLVLVREWSNLSEYREQAMAVCSPSELQSLSTFIVDIDNDIKHMLSGERSDWRDLLGDLRGRLIGALRQPGMADMARREFHYVASAELLVRLQYAQARIVSDDDRGPGFWNSVSMGINDTWSETGANTEDAFATYRGAATTAVSAVDGSAEEQAAVTQSDQAYSTYLQSHEEYEAAKASSAAIAGAIVGVIVGTIVTILSAGTAGPACAGFLGTIMGASFTELTEVAIEGNSYDAEKGAQDLAVALVTGVITLGMGQVVDKIADGAAATARVQAIDAALKARFGDTFARYAGTVVGKGALESALSSFPSAYASDLMRTEGLLRQDLGGATSALRQTAQDYGVSLITKGVQHAVNDRTDVLAGLRRSGDWDEYADQLLEQKLIDLAITTAASQLVAGELPNTQGMVKLICKVASTTSSARASASAAERDVGSTLEFFNSADSATLQSIRFIGDATASRIIAARGEGGFSSLEELLAVPRFTERVLTPAAAEIRNDFLQKRDAAAAASSNDAAPTGG